MTRRTRRQITEETILDAFREQLVIHGFERVGVNAVARRAGVSKELIYRYFGGMDQLARAFMRGNDYWSLKEGDEAEEDDDGAAKPAKDAAVVEMVLDQLAQLRARPDYQEIRRWEMIDKTEITNEIAAEREAASLEFLSRLEIAEESEEAVIVGLLLSSVLYLVLRSKTADSFFGIALDDDAGWRRVEATIRTIVPKLLGPVGE